MNATADIDWNEPELFGTFLPFLVSDCEEANRKWVKEGMAFNKIASDGCDLVAIHHVLPRAFHQFHLYVF